MQSVMPTMANKEFIDDNDADNFKVVYQFANGTKENIDTFKKQLKEAVKDVEYFKLSVSEDIYNRNTIFIVVHGLKSIDGARGFAEILKDNKDKKSKRPKIDKEYFAISSQNYQIVQIHKNLNVYLEKE